MWNPPFHQVKNLPIRWTAHPHEVKNFRTDQPYQMVPVQEELLLDRHMFRLANICNEEAIYQTLFSERLQGKAYSTADARNFLQWATEGWLSQTHFVFVILDHKTEICAAIDIKSANRQSAEIGYWCSQNHTGLMTNAVNALSQLAAQAGFQELFALTKKDNHSSSRVLLRAGFTRDDHHIDDCSHDRYSKKILG